MFKEAPAVQYRGKKVDGYASTLFSYSVRHAQTKIKPWLGAWIVKSKKIPKLRQIVCFLINSTHAHHYKCEGLIKITKNKKIVRRY
jgi:hypothetical protein